MLLAQQEAAAAMQQINGYRLDSKHVFAVSKFDDFDKYARVPTEYVKAEEKPYEPKVAPSPSNLH